MSCKNCAVIVEECAALQRVCYARIEELENELRLKNARLRDVEEHNDRLQRQLLLNRKKSATRMQSPSRGEGIEDPSASPIVHVAAQSPRSPMLSLQSPIE